MFLASCETDILTQIMYVTQGEIKSRVMEYKDIVFLRNLLKPIAKFQGVLTEQAAVLNTRPCRAQD